MSELRGMLVSMAYEVVAMDQEITHLQAEVAKLEGFRQKYDDLIRSNIQHSRDMLGGILEIAMTPEVLDAIDKNNRGGEVAHEG